MSKITVAEIMKLYKSKISRKDAARLVQAVEEGAYTAQEACRIADRRHNEKINVFRGKPSKEYPKGRLYSPELIFRTLKEKGIRLTMSAARERIRSVRRNPEREDGLFRAPGTQPARKGGWSSYEPPMDKTRQFSKVEKGELSLNTLLYGEPSERVKRSYK